MNEEKKELLSSYLKSGISPILLEDIPSSVFETAVIIDATKVTINDLCGHYEKTEYVAPNWYKELIKNDSLPRILIIDKINELDLNDQGKFGEILKYKKVSTFDLPEDTIIFLTVKNLKEHRVAENIFTLCACI